MNRNKNYLSTILIIAAAGFSLYVIAQNFLVKRNQGETQAALPLVIPTLALLIPIAIVLLITIFREVKYRKILSKGIKSVGFIKKVTETGNYIRKMPEIKLELDVLGGSGNKFSGEVMTVVHPAELEFLKKGEPVPVIYNIDDKNDISVDRKPDVDKLKEQISEYKKQNKIY